VNCGGWGVLEDTIAAVVDAQARGLTLKFGYQKTPSRLEARIIDNPRIDGLHLLGWDLHRLEYRTFLLLNVRGAVVGPAIKDLVAFGQNDPEVLGDADGQERGQDRGGGPGEPGGSGVRA